MSICRGCGMVLGQDCFNEQDCMWISESMQQMYEQEQCSQAENQDVDALHNRIKQLEQELAVANKCINSLRLSLGETRLRNGDHEANLIELNALLEQSKKDQSRYLWMRESKNKWHVLSGEDLDSSIDAAIAAKESSK